MNAVQVLLQKLTDLGCDPLEAMELVTKAMATASKGDAAAEKRRKWDREYRRKTRPKKGQQYCPSTRHQVEIHPTEDQVEIHLTTDEIHLTSTRQNGHIYSKNISSTELREEDHSLNIYPRQAEKRPPDKVDLIKEEFFKTIYPAYPLKKGRKKGLEAYQKARKKVSAEVILDGILAYRDNKPPQHDWAYIASWLNGERWDDEYTAPSQLFAKPPSQSQQNREQTRAIFTAVQSEFDALLSNRPPHRPALARIAAGTVPSGSQHDQGEDAGDGGYFLDLPGNHAPADSPPRNGHGH